jgi:hypothetical protein
LAIFSSFCIIKIIGGDVYSGNFENGKFEGEGTYTFVTGDKYVGSFKNDVRCGLGTITNKDGSQYTGEWQNNKATGQGEKIYANGIKFVGTFKREEPVDGIQTKPDGTTRVMKKGKFVKVEPPVEEKVTLNE